MTILMFISSGVVYAADKTNEVKFADPIVEAAIREVIGKPSGTIHEDEVEVITWLIIHANPLPWEKVMLDLSGLEHLSKLRQLTISKAGVKDFSPLAGLTGLESIGFNSCEITGLVSLSALPNLQSLGLRDCDVDDFSALKLCDLAALRQLDITNTLVRDVSQLSFPAGLWSLRLQNNGINEIPQLSNLTNLVNLGLVENKIRDITPLATLDRLGSLDLYGNHISDIGPLSGLSNLSCLGLQENDITDLAPLADGSKYKYDMGLRIQGNPLSDDSIEVYIPQIEKRGIKVIYHDIEKGNEL